VCYAVDEYWISAVIGAEWRSLVAAEIKKLNKSGKQEEF
jgi:hypothetical protein